MGRVIVVSNRKGGTGKTTSSVNISAGLSILKGKRVLLVDIDPQASSTVWLNSSPLTPSQSIFGVLMGDTKIENVIYKTGIDDLYICPSHTFLSKFEPVLFFKRNGEFIFKGLIDRIRDKFDYIIIDPPPSVGILTLSALISADEIIIPVKYDFLSIDATTTFLSVLAKVIDKRNKNLKIDGVFFTFVNPDKFSPDDVYFGGMNVRKFKSFISFDEKLVESAKKTLPIFLSFPDSISARNYLSLIEEIEALEV
ncbi:MAG: ParA family protein [Brevinematia bacterium]